MKPIISVKGIAKQYTLGSQLKAANSFREMILGVIASPFKNFRQLSGKDSSQQTFWALSNISFEVQPGEVVGVIGRNGAGKSTLLKILSRITTPTEGQIEYQGQMASLLEVGTGFHPELTGRENIYLNGAILGMGRQQITERLDDIVEFAEISKFLDTPVKRFSSGMYVRLAFSVAAHLNPDILIVDEVLAVGDQAFQQKCLGKLKDTGGDGRTVFFVSHNMTAVKSLCNRIIYLKDGKIEYDGSPDEAISRYLSVGKSGAAQWSDDTNKHDHLKKVSLSSNMNSDMSTEASTNLFQYSESIEVLIEFENTKRRAYRPAVRITDVFGNVLFTSWDKDSLAESDRKEVKKEVLVCSIPANLLKPAGYTLTAFAHVPDDNGNVKVEEVNFDITVSAEHCPIDLGRLGLIFPILEWQRHADAHKSNDKR